MIDQLGDDVAEVVRSDIDRCRSGVRSLNDRIFNDHVEADARLMARSRIVARAAASDEDHAVVGMVDLSEVVVSQSVVAIDRGPSPDESEPTFDALLDLCVPEGADVSPVVGYDNRSQSWIIRGKGASIDVVGRYSGPLHADDPSTQLFGFLVRAEPSRVTVRRANGRLVLIDGHHRAVSLFRRGVRRVPALVVDGSDRAVGDDATRGSLPDEAVLSATAPRLADYFDESVSTPCHVARVDPMTVVSATSLQAPA